jgi:hypothetical protein
MRSKTANIDNSTEVLYRLKGSLGAVIYLMGGSRHALTHEFEDLETWLCSIRDQVEEALAGLS